ncbi:MAG: chromosomal replication initiator protein DnaA [Clostridia bacterium]|nr:chromosomal replication initiator protein DnaA [Clostridia bacterium]
MLDLKYIFQGVLDYVREKYDYIDVTMNLWFNPLKLIKMDGGRVTVLCGDDWKRSVIEEKYFSSLIDGFQHELEIKEIDLTLITQEEYEAAQAEEQKKKAEEIKKEENKEEEIYINPAYTFNNFVVGSSNRVAYETSLLVCNSPAEYYNPLFLYGPSGLGKTHLLFAIINEIKKNRPDFKVVYITCEEFTNMLVDSISKKTDPMIFRSKFRGLDFLLVDDIQFLAGKKAVQEEMFHTFEALYNKGKQVVFASDRHPSEMENIDKRLTTRFSMGGLFDIEPPDTELRQAIFKHKADNYGVEIPNNVLQFLAENIKTNIRQIEGAIKTLKAHSLINGEEISLAMAKRVLSEYLRKAEEDSINAEKILKYVSMRYGIKKEDITGPKRDTAVKNARHICAFLMRDMLNLTYKEIGNILGKHHSTIMDSCLKVEGNIKKSDTYRREIEEIERELKA